MIEEDKAKQDVIGSVLYDEEYGYGSKINSLKHARQINEGITMDDINKFMNKVTFRNKEGYRNYNSFTVNFPWDEYMVDIAEMGDLNGEYKYLFICVDIFSKSAYGIEMPDKKITLQHLYQNRCLKKLEYLRQ